MPEFSPGEQKNAIVPMTNPTAKAFDYSAELYMGTDLALMVSKDFHLEAGESKGISLSVTMPSSAGTYPVHIGVFSVGENIALYRAVEDVVIKALVALPFTFGNVWCKTVVLTEAPAWRTIEWYCIITNPNNVSVTQPLKLMLAPDPSLGYYYPRLFHSFSLALAPGQSYSFKWDGNAYRSPGVQFGPTAPCCMYLEDEQGNKSDQCCI